MYTQFFATDTWHPIGTVNRKTYKADQNDRVPRDEVAVGNNYIARLITKLPGVISSEYAQDYAVTVTDKKSIVFPKTRIAVPGLVTVTLNPARESYSESAIEGNFVFDPKDLARPLLGAMIKDGAWAKGYLLGTEDDYDYGFRQLLENKLPIPPANPFEDPSPNREREQV